MVSTPMSWTGVAILLVAIALAILVTPVIAFAGIVGLGLIWAAPNQAGTTTPTPTTAPATATSAARAPTTAAAASE
ncbi:hypothetical protein DSM104299_02830 [Baekduia alba]|uniref:hypothetical protein n=1 Tax=Baekduia alba TaxID=2997333 RepID=UPI0023414C0F|nr:hypothetical protein [Baekduia alba]WCB94102.1 hypothetical protein DSM104299_02830 [Baekduia alba]